MKLKVSHEPLTIRTFKTWDEKGKWLEISIERGGEIIRELEYCVQKKYNILGIEAMRKKIRLFKEHYPNATFINEMGGAWKKMKPYYLEEISQKGFNSKEYRKLAGVKGGI